MFRQVCILDNLILFSIFPIFSFSLLFLSIFCETRRLAWDTPDSPMPKYWPISFNFSPVYLLQRYIITFLARADSLPNTVPTSSKISCIVAFSVSSFKAGMSFAGSLPDKYLSLIKAMKSGLPSRVELMTSSSGMSYFFEQAQLQIFDIHSGQLKPSCRNTIE